MSGFSADWLAMREAADLRSRSPLLIRAAARDLGGLEAPRVCDLGAGTGAMRRALAPAFPSATRWVLVDDDAGLLARAEAGEGATVTADLGAEQDDEEALGHHVGTPSAWIGAGDQPSLARGYSGHNHTAVSAWSSSAMAARRSIPGGLPSASAAPASNASHGPASSASRTGTPVPTPSATARPITAAPSA